MGLFPTNPIASCVLSVLAVLPGFLLFSHLGRRVSGLLYKKSKWLLLGVSYLVMACSIIPVCLTTEKLSLLPTVLLGMCIGFSMGLLRSQPDRAPVDLSPWRRSRRKA